MSCKFRQLKVTYLDCNLKKYTGIKKTFHLRAHPKYDNYRQTKGLRLIFTSDGVGVVSGVVRALMT